jgi:hypothetical protein
MVCLGESPKLPVLVDALIREQGTKCAADILSKPTDRFRFFVYANTVPMIFGAAQTASIRT